jgi:methylated-DNA-protein-cysteine methyltransferase-like protein
VGEQLERFCLVLSQIPKGCVCSYGQLAKMAELSNARQSCRLLRHLPDGSHLPWYRIVNAQGKLADYAGASIQRELLEAEGVCFTKSGRIPKHYFI